MVTTDADGSVPGEGTEEMWLVDQVLIISLLLCIKKGALTKKNLTILADFG